MSRLPTVGGDDNTWGGILNDFLGVEHNADGSLKNVARPSDLTAKADTSTVNSELATKADDSAVVHKSDYTAKGDILTATGSAATARLGVGSDAQVLTADSTQGGGMRWETRDRSTQFKIFDDLTVLTAGDGKLIFCIASEMNGLNLVEANAFVTTASTSGTPTIQIRNVTQSADMLTTPITIDANEFTSYTAATPPIIDPAHDSVATGDLIAIDVDVTGTGAQGLGVLLRFG